LEAGMIVYPLNPKSAQAYRERKAPSGVKDDRIRLANTRLASSRDLVGQFRVARAAGVSSAMRLIGKSPNPGSTEPR
jgi:hypothetical protein